MSESDELAIIEERPDGQLVDKSQILGEDDQAYTAYKLRQAGHDWAVIADQLGYANPKTAEVCVRTYLQRAALGLSMEHREEALQLEIDRLDQLTAAYWPSALRGEVKHAELILKAVAQRARLLGLEELHNKAQQSTKTIVIAGDPGSGEYASALKALVEGEL